MVKVWSMEYFQILEYYVTVIKEKANLLISSNFKGGRSYSLSFGLKFHYLKFQERFV